MARWPVACGPWLSALGRWSARGGSTRADRRAGRILLACPRPDDATNWLYFSKGTVGFPSGQSRFWGGGNLPGDGAWGDGNDFVKIVRGKRPDMEEMGVGDSNGEVKGQGAADG